MKSFEYIKGNAKTTTPWFRPRGNLLNLWRDDFFKLEGVEKYSFWITGGAIEDWDTWDTDITILGDLQELKELETIMTEAVRIGFKHRQLIDINWVDYMYKTAILQDYENLSLAYKKKDANLVYKIERQLISMCSFVKKNGKIYTPSDSREQISDFLWKRTLSSPSEKQKQRIKSGIPYRGEPVLITKDLDFRKIIR